MDRDTPSPEPLVYLFIHSRMSAVVPKKDKVTVCRAPRRRKAHIPWGAARGELSYLAPLGSEKISAPYFKHGFFQGGVITPQTESNTTPPSPKTKITYILFYILNLWLRIYCSGLRGCDTREKEIAI